MHNKMVMSPLWIFLGMVLIATMGCVFLAIPHDRNMQNTPILTAVIIIVIFGFMGIIYRKKNWFTKAAARQLTSNNDTTSDEHSSVLHTEQQIIKYSWILFLGALPGIALLIYHAI